MNNVLNLLSFIKPANKEPEKVRRWYYQFEGEEVREIYKEGKYWYFISKGGGRQGNSQLRGAKGDLEYSGAKVWSKLEDYK